MYAESQFQIYASSTFFIAIYTVEMTCYKVKCSSSGQVDLKQPDRNFFSDYP